MVFFEQLLKKLMNLNGSFDLQDDDDDSDIDVENINESESDTGTDALRQADDDDESDEEDEEEGDASASGVSGICILTVCCVCENLLNSLKIFPNTEVERLLPGVIFDPVSEPSSGLSDGQLLIVTCLVVDDISC
jgi:hypothetical protein